MQEYVSSPLDFVAEPGAGIATKVFILMFWTILTTFLIFWIRDNFKLDRVIWGQIFAGHEFDLGELASSVFDMLSIIVAVAVLLFLLSLPLGMALRWARAEGEGTIFIARLGLLSGVIGTILQAVF